MTKEEYYNFTLHDCCLTDIKKQGQGLELRLDGIFLREDDATNPLGTLAFAGPAKAQLPFGEVIRIYLNGKEVPFTDGFFQREGCEFEINTLTLLEEELWKWEGQFRSKETEDHYCTGELYITMPEGSRFIWSTCCKEG